MTRYFVGIGSNYHSFQNCTAMINAVRFAFRNVCVSSVVTTPAFGVDAPNYVNAVVSFESSLSFGDVLSWCKTLENKLGRTRNADGICQADLDILQPDNVREPFFQPLVAQLQSFLQGVTTRIDVNSVCLELDEQTETGTAPCFISQAEFA